MSGFFVAKVQNAIKGRRRDTEMLIKTHIQKKIERTIETRATPIKCNLLYDHYGFKINDFDYGRLLGLTFVLTYDHLKFEMSKMTHNHSFIH